MFGVSPRPLTPSPLLGQRGLLGQVVACAVQVRSRRVATTAPLAFCHGPRADPVARVDRRRCRRPAACSDRRARSCRRAGAARERLALLVGAGQAAEVCALARAGARDEESRGRSCRPHCPSCRRRPARRLLPSRAGSDRIDRCIVLSFVVLGSNDGVRCYAQTHRPIPSAASLSVPCPLSRAAPTPAPRVVTRLCDGRAMRLRCSRADAAPPLPARASARCRQRAPLAAPAARRRTDRDCASRATSAPTRRAAPSGGTSPAALARTANAWFGFQITFFRPPPASLPTDASRFAASQLVFAHAALTDIAGKRLRHDQRIARAGFGVADAALADTRLRLRDWHLERARLGRLRRSAATGSA